MIEECFAIFPISNGMNPQQENKQNNSNEPIRIIPRRNGVIPPVQKAEQKIFSQTSVGADTKPIPTPVENVEEKIVFRPDNKIKISPLHTYADDVKSAVQSDGVSMAKIVMAEAKKQEAEKVSESELSPTSDKNKSIITISIVVILVAVVGFAGTWYFVNKRDAILTPVEQQRKPSVIPYDEEFVVSLEARERKKLVEIIDQSKKQNYQKETAIVYLPILYKGGTSTLTMSTENFLATLDARASSALVRAFGTEFMFGLNRIAGQPKPFLLLYSDSFNQMYAGMLEWEPAMADDIGDLFFTKDDLVEVSAPDVSNPQTFAKQNLGGQATSTSTSTSTKATLAIGTTSTTTSFGIATTSTSTIPEMNTVEQKAFKSKYIIANSLKFKDEVLNNRDMRVLRTVSGKVLMYYTFINDEILLIAKDYGTLDEVVKRLATSQFKQ